MARFKNNREGAFTLGGVSVGAKEVGTIANKEWADFKKSTFGKAMLKSGDIQEIEAVSKEAPQEADGAEGDDQRNALATLNAEKARDLVKNTNDLALLTQWEETEKRTSVLQAIAAQRALIEKA